MGGDGGFVKDIQYVNGRDFLLNYVNIPKSFGLSSHDVKEFENVVRVCCAMAVYHYITPHMLQRVYEG